jgi:endonuclease YncB( thermonuclease family)
VAADHGDDLNCSDFTYDEDALEHLRAHPGDPDGLERDNDGRPCDSLPSRPASQPAPAPPRGAGFTDVLPGGAHTEAIEAMAAAGVISGYPDGTFRPSNDVSRGQMASLLYRALDFPPGTQSFVDTAGTTHQTAIAALASAGVVTGYLDGTFRPGNPISRGQMATMIARAFDLPPTAGSSRFSDVVEGSTHASGINALAAAGITSGFADGTFRPALNTPRAQTASFLYRAINTDRDPSLGWTVTHVVDGDTLDVTSTTGVIERVRLVGVDAPERGECGFTEATDALRQLTLGQQVMLVPGAQDDRDRYGRLLRYIDVGGTDAGLEMIRRGLAIARYDSRDGYGAHPREADYIAADASIGQLCGA